MSQPASPHNHPLIARSVAARRFHHVIQNVDHLTRHTPGLIRWLGRAHSSELCGRRMSATSIEQQAAMVQALSLPSSSQQQGRLAGRTNPPPAADGQQALANRRSVWNEAVPRSRQRSSLNVTCTPLSPAPDTGNSRSPCAQNGACPVLRETGRRDRHRSTPSSD